MDLNKVYFDALFSKFKENRKESIVLHEPEMNRESNIICIPIASQEEMASINIKNYNDLDDSDFNACSNFEYTLVKMQAGLGSSVKRDDLIKEVEGRDNLGAKGTDLYFEVDSQMKSISEIQLLQANALSKKRIYKKINYKNLVNDETESAVKKSTQKVELNPLCELKDSYYQKKMPTIDETGELTTDRMAPAGHGFIGYCEILATFLEDTKPEIVAIGNGEDLSSTPDEKIVSWMIKEALPIVMMTTTKTAMDKKGGQISIVKPVEEGKSSYVTIIEKAQAEQSNQLEYFEDLGLRKGDRHSLFNTNIVLINKKALKDIFNKYISGIDIKAFLDSFSPDVIQNTKEQDGKQFIQLESALGSVILTLDKYFRLNFNSPLVSFLNLEEENRKGFFMPIKKREDFDQIFKAYRVDLESYKLIPKTQS